MSSPRRFVAAAVAILAAVLMVPTTASAATPSSTTLKPAQILTLPGALDGILLTGVAEGAPPCGDRLPVKNLVALQRVDWMWAPLRLADAERAPVRDLNKILVPYAIAASGDVPAELRTRHLNPGESLTRPGPVPRELVTCSFTGEIVKGETFTVTIQGTILPFPSKLLPIKFAQTV